MWTILQVSIMEERCSQNVPEGYQCRNFNYTLISTLLAEFLPEVCWPSICENGELMWSPKPKLWIDIMANCLNACQYSNRICSCIFYIKGYMQACENNIPDLLQNSAGQALRKRLRICSVISVNYHYIHVTVLCPFNLLIRFKCYNTV